MLLRSTINVYGLEYAVVPLEESEPVTCRRENFIIGKLADGLVAVFESWVDITTGTRWKLKINLEEKST